MAKIVGRKNTVGLTGGKDPTFLKEQIMDDIDKEKARDILMVEYQAIITELKKEVDNLSKKLYKRDCRILFYTKIINHLIDKYGYSEPSEY